MRKLLPTALLVAVLLPSPATEGAERPDPVKISAYWALLGSKPHAPCDPYALTRDDKQTDSASLLYVIRREYRSALEMAEATGIPRAAVERKLGELKACGLVQESAGRFLVGFPFWDRPLRDEINALGRELATRVAGIIESELPGLQTAFERTSLPSQGFAWGDASLVVVGGLLLDTGINDRGLRAWKRFDQRRDTPIRPDNHRYWYRAVEGGWGPYWKFGHDLAHDDARDLWFGMFYGSKPGRQIRWSQAWDVHDERTRSILFPLLGRTGATVGELLEKTGLPEKELLWNLRVLEEKKVIRLEGLEVRPAFPIFQEEDVTVLFTQIDKVAGRVIEEVFIPFQPRIEERWKAIRPETWKFTGIDRFIHREVFDRNYNLTLDHLIEKGVLPPSPVEPPFDYWGIHGHYRVL